MARIHTALKMVRLQSSIKWHGLVRLHQLKEDDETYLSEIDHPSIGGTMVYVCASTGLMFDKQSGRCLQSSHMDLLLESVAETKCSAKQFVKWVNDRSASGNKNITIKRGPKPKGQRSMVEQEYDYAAMD